MAIRNQLHRRDIAGTARFLTCSCYRRRKLFNNDRIKDAFVYALTASAAKHEMSVLAWVVMPEHIHLIVFAEPGERDVVPGFLKTLKQPFARQVLNRWRAIDAAILGGLVDKAGTTRFWQPGGFDRNVVGQELIEKIRYVHKNPVTRGLSPDPTRYKWSSAATYRALPTAIGPPLAFDLVPKHDRPLT